MPQAIPASQPIAVRVPRAMQPGVHNRQTLEAIRHVSHLPQADWTTPVLAQERDVL